MPDINPIIGSEEEYLYRNKLEYTFSNKRWHTKEEVESGVEFEREDALGFHIPGLFDKVWILTGAIFSLNLQMP